MTEILVESLDEEISVVQPTLQTNSSIQMQGFAADASVALGQVASPPAAMTDPYGFTDSSERRDRTSSKASVPTSVRSEPDLDTILPLPGVGLSRRPGGRGGGGGGYQRLSGDGSDTESEGSGEAGGTTGIATFTKVEVLHLN